METKCPGSKIRSGGMGRGLGIGGGKGPLNGKNLRLRNRLMRLKRKFRPKMEDESK